MYPNLECNGRDGVRCIYIYTYIWIHKYIYIYIIYIYLDTQKDEIFCPYGFGHFFLSVTFFFPNTAMFGFHPSTYRSIAFLKSWIYRTGSDSIVSRLETVFGAVCWHLLTVFFQHDVEKILVFFGYIQIWWEIWQYLWPDLGTLWRLPFCSTSGWNSSFGDCRRIWFEPPFTIKNPNTQLNKKKTYVMGKTHNGQKKLSARFSRYIYIL